MTGGTLVAAASYLIQQKYQDYTADQHAVWAELVRRRRPHLDAHACREYLDGYEIIGLQDDRLPNLYAISGRLKPRTGWSTTPVSGFLPGAAFFEMLAARMFPVTTWPMHAHPVFAEFLQHYGMICAKVKDAEALERLGRLFWYTVEFGLIRQDGEIKVYGSGVISSHRECTNVIDGGCEVRDFSLDEVLATPVKVDEIQKRLFAIKSFDQIYEAVREAEKRTASVI